jgi:hypothetical protein
MEDHENRFKAQPILGRVVPGMERQCDGHVAEKGVARIGEVDRFGIGEPPGRCACAPRRASLVSLPIILGVGCSRRLCPHPLPRTRAKGLRRRLGETVAEVIDQAGGDAVRSLAEGIVPLPL